MKYICLGFAGLFLSQATHFGGPCVGRPYPVARPPISQPYYEEESSQSFSNNNRGLGLGRSINGPKRSCGTGGPAFGRRFNNDDSDSNSDRNVPYGHRRGFSLSSNNIDDSSSFSRESYSNGNGLGLGRENRDRRGFGLKGGDKCGSGNERGLGLGLGRSGNGYGYGHINGNGREIGLGGKGKASCQKNNGCNCRGCNKNKKCRDERSSSCSS